MAEQRHWLTKYNVHTQKEENNPQYSYISHNDACLITRFLVLVFDFWLSVWVLFFGSRFWVLVFGSQFWFFLVFGSRFLDFGSWPVLVFVSRFWFLVLGFDFGSWF